MVALYHKWSAFHIFKKIIGDGFKHRMLFSLGYRGLLSTIETGADGKISSPSSSFTVKKI